MLLNHERIVRRFDWFLLPLMEKGIFFDENTIQFIFKGCTQRYVKINEGNHLITLATNRSCLQCNNSNISLFSNRNIV